MVFSMGVTVASAEPADPVIPIPIYAVEDNGDLSAASINAKGAICVDVDTGTTLFEQDADLKLYPASITKVMTCLLSLEYVEKSTQGLNEVVTVDHVYNLEEGAVNIGMKVGEQFTMEQLLYALMLKSANDVAELLAEHIGGTIEGFADMMNAKAQELGMTNTHYVNPQWAA